MKEAKLVAAALLSSLFIQGCATGGTKEETAVAEEVIESGLMQVANEIRDAQTVVANLGRAHAPAADARMWDAPDLERTITVVNWHGELEVILSDIADRVGYRFERIGKKPAVAFIVHADYNRKTVNSALRDLALQAGNGAQIDVDGGRRRIILKYLKH